MTKAGEKWLDKIGINRSASDAGKALHAFVDEIEKRADAHFDFIMPRESYDWDYALVAAWKETKRELLG